MFQNLDNVKNKVQAQWVRGFLGDQHPWEIPSKGKLGITTRPPQQAARPGLRCRPRLLVCMVAVKVHVNFSTFNLLYKFISIPSDKMFTAGILVHTFISSTQRQKQEDLWELKASLVY